MVTHSWPMRPYCAENFVMLLGSMDVSSLAWPLLACRCAASVGMSMTYSISSLSAPTVTMARP